MPGDLSEAIKEISESADAKFRTTDLAVTIADAVETSYYNHHYRIRRTAGACIELARRINESSTAQQKEIADVSETTPNTIRENANEIGEIAVENNVISQDDYEDAFDIDIANLNKCDPDLPIIEEFSTNTDRDEYIRGLRSFVAFHDASHEDIPEAVTVDDVRAWIYYLLDEGHPPEGTVRPYYTGTKEFLKLKKPGAIPDDQFQDILTAYEEQDEQPIDTPESPEHIQREVVRPERNTQLVKQLKSRYDHCCQVCGYKRYRSPSEPYAEAHHLYPLGEGGPDISRNIVVVCPNHHKDLDHGMIAVDPETLQIDHMYEELSGVLEVEEGDSIGTQFLEYHNKNVVKYDNDGF